MDCRVKPGNDGPRFPDAMQHEVLRRAGIVPNAGALYAPGSAAHRYALRCVRGTRASILRTERIIPAFR
jgi:hypothetical protein